MRLCFQKSIFLRLSRPPFSPLSFSSASYIAFDGFAFDIFAAFGPGYTVPYLDRSRFKLGSCTGELHPVDIVTMLKLIDCFFFHFGFDAFLVCMFGFVALYLLSPSCCHTHIYMYISPCVLYARLLRFCFC